MGPESWLLLRSNRDTRPLVTVTPYHCDTGPVSQFVWFSQWGPGILSNVVDEKVGRILTRIT
jgi:hypothetical protein